MTYFLARYYDDKIVTCSMNPGGTKTNLQRYALLKVILATEQVFRMTNLDLAIFRQFPER